MKLKHAVIPFEIKAAPLEESSSDYGQFSGYGSTFGDIDFGGDMVAKGAFTETLKEWNNKNQLPMMPWYHDMSEPIGDWLTMEEDEKGLFVKGQLWVKGGKRLEKSVMAHNLITGTGPKGMSIGYAVEEEEKMQFNGGEVRLLKKIKLFELSIVPFGMNPKAGVTQAKSLVDGDGQIIDIRSFEKTLRDVGGLSTSQAKKLLSGGYKALSGCDDQLIDDDIGSAFKNLTKGML